MSERAGWASERVGQRVNGCDNERAGGKVSERAGQEWDSERVSGIVSKHVRARASERVRQLTSGWDSERVGQTGSTRQASGWDSEQAR